MGRNEWSRMTIDEHPDHLRITVMHKDNLGAYIEIKPEDIGKLIDALQASKDSYMKVGA